MLLQECTQLFQNKIVLFNKLNFHTIPPQKKPLLQKERKGKGVPFVVGFDIAKMAGLVEVEPLRASNT